MNIEVKAEEAENTKNDQNTNPHITEDKSHQKNFDKNFPAGQQEKNLNFFEQNYNQRKTSKENNHEITASNFNYELN